MTGSRECGSSVSITSNHRVEGGSYAKDRASEYDKMA